MIKRNQNKTWDVVRCSTHLVLLLLGCVYTSYITPVNSPLLAGILFSLFFYPFLLRDYPNSSPGFKVCLWLILPVIIGSAIRLMENAPWVDETLLMSQILFGTVSGVTLGAVIFWQKPNSKSYVKSRRIK